MNKKIEQWQKEIEKIQKNEAEMLKKNKSKIKEFRAKIAEEQKREELENNKAIAEAVRSVYGEVTQDNIQDFVQMWQKHGNTLGNVNE